MQGSAYKCSCCPYVFKEEEINFQTRRATCPRCDAVTTFSRSVVNGSTTVLHDVENAVRFFEERNFESAKRFAESALSVSYDNVVGLYIIAYYNAYCASVKKRTHLDKFFNEELPEITVDPDEMEALKKVLKKSALHVADYEQAVLSKILETDPPESIPEFVDAFSPYIVNKRASIDWFTPEMKDIYVELTRRANLPKTWYALFQQIDANPDSPEQGNTYYLKTKTARFYHDYVCGVGEIYDAITDEALKTKFTSAFGKKKQIFVNKMNG